MTTMINLLDQVVAERDAAYKEIAELKAKLKEWQEAAPYHIEDKG